jgi:subtilisin family serine protease
LLRNILPATTESDNPVPDKVIGYVKVHGKQSVFDNPKKGLLRSAKAYRAKQKDIDSVRRDLEKSGFKILAESQLGLSVLGDAKQFEELTGGKVGTVEKLVHTGGDVHKYVTHLDITGKNQPKTLGVGLAKSKSLIDGIVLENPKQFHAVFPSPIPLPSPKYHLNPPNDIAVLLGAVKAHQQGILGQGVMIAMPDTGWYRHPYFTANQYNIKTPIVAVPGTNPSKDPAGHGTAQSANIFAVAPAIRLQPIRATDSAGNLVGPVTAFLKAKALAPQIISNSWCSSGVDYPPTGGPDEADLSFAAEVIDAIENGILVIFAAGNGQFAVEPQIPGVLAAGGVYVDQDGVYKASDMASGYRSRWFGGVVVPTVCGLCGMQRGLKYLMLPVPAGSPLDRSASVGVAGAQSDFTAPDDGWAVLSGTSCAAPQIAGASALILSARPRLRPAQVAEALSRTAYDIVLGNSSSPFNQPAGPGFDNATGWGLINASAAVEYAKSRF